MRPVIVPAGAERAHCPESGQVDQLASDVVVMAGAATGFQGSELTFSIPLAMITPVVVVVVGAPIES